MLSIENPPSESDPPHPCQLKKKKLSNLPHLDPSPPPSSSSSLSSSFDSHHHNSKINPNQVPNFSIRDYVFAVRNSDVKKNWPFSLENLQLCLKHGVKDPLPPFQTIDSVKSQSLKPCTAEVVRKLDDASTTKKLTGHAGKCKPRSKSELPSTSTSAGKCKPRSESELPSTSTSVYQSEIESLEANQSALDLKNPPLRSRTENTSKPASKKCRIVVKFGSVSAEDIASNLTTASEHMASSKTCPVCKTFSSSSNTTLNAHIDQCLASGSKPSLASGSRSVRHKIKPRKIRLMTDIYTTAKECTLEELDRRNGTSWAVLNSNVPVLDTGKSEDMLEEGENQRVPLDCSKGAVADQAPVYVDANGTKVRILSKLDDDTTTATKASKDVIGPNKPTRGGKGGKFFSSKKKSRHGKKRHKYLKLVPQSTKLLPQKVHTSQVSAGPEGFSREENQKKEERRAPRRIKLVSTAGISRQWVPLKCATVTKELNKKGCRRNLPSENDETCLHDSFVRRNQTEKVSRSSGNKVGNIESPLLPMKRSTDHLSNVSTSAHQSPILRSAENNRNCVSPLGRKKMCSSAGLGKPMKETPAFGSRTLKVLSAGKNVSTTQQSAVEQKLDAGKRRFTLKKMRPQFLDEGDDDHVAREPSIDRECDLMQNGFGDHYGSEMVSRDTSFGTSVRLSREEPVALQGSRRVSRYHELDNGEIADSSLRVLDLCNHEADSLSDSDSESDNDGDDSADDDDVLEDFDGQEIYGERGTTSLSRFLGTEFIERNISETPFDSSQSVDEYTGASSEGQPLLHPSDQPSFLGGREVYSAGEAGNATSDRAACMDMELDSKTGHGSSFPEVEPIPIPGPPGSFLPSPRDMMASDDFLGHSSLTTSPVRSSEDHRDFIDRISSDSPVSMASTVSNSTTAGRHDHMKYFEKLSSGAMEMGQEKNLDSAASSQQTSIEAERSSETEKFSFNGTAVEKKPFGFRSDDDQPCCCQRKERFSQGFISLNFQESQLLKRRTMTFSERQVGIVSNPKPSNSRSTPGTTAPSNCLLPLVSEPQGLPDIPTRKPFLEEPSVLKPSSDIDRTSSSPSGSNPVLRLMGKNLMVINIEEDASMRLSHGDSGSKPPAHPAVPSFHHMAPRGCSFAFDRDTRDACDVGNYFSSNFSPRAPQILAQAPGGMLQNHYTVPFSLFKPQDSSFVHGEAPELQNSENFSSIPLKRANTSPVRLSCTPEGSGNMQRSSLSSSGYYSRSR